MKNRRLLEEMQRADGSDGTLGRERWHGFAEVMSRTPRIGSFE
jgi:hypothetical protein